jgi:predicted DNA binding CopG/RHH family protein
MDKQKIEKLKKHANDQGYTILDDETERVRNMMSDSTVTIRMPNDLKNMLKQKAAELHVPYQRYIKSILIDALKKSS